MSGGVTDLRSDLQAALDELARNGWHTRPVPAGASDIDLASRLVDEQARLRVMREDIASRARAIQEGGWCK